MGLSHKRAAAHACISHHTLKLWLGRGREGEPEYEDLLFQVEQAEKDFQWVHLENIAAAAKGGILTHRKTSVSKSGDESVDEKYSSPAWQASAWLLERTDNRFALSKKVEHSGNVRHESINIDVETNLSEAQQAELIKLLTQAEQQKVIEVENENENESG